MITRLRDVYALLVEEYPLTRHIFWLDESTGNWVNDVTETLHLIVRASQGAERGDLEHWEHLVLHCIGRSMSPVLLKSIGAYLYEQHALPALPLVRLWEPPYRNWQGETVPLFDETDRPQMTGNCERPEPERQFYLKHQQGWTLRPMSLKPMKPAVEKQAVASTKHWLF